MKSVKKISVAKIVGRGNKITGWYRINKMEIEEDIKGSFFKIWVIRFKAAGFSLTVIT